MNFEDFSPELQEKVKTCKTVEDIVALAKEEGYSLSDEELEAVSAGGGGWCKAWDTCSKVCFPNFNP